MRTREELMNPSERKEIKQAIKALKEYCSAEDEKGALHCDSCILHDGSDCMIGDHYPNEWKLPEEPPIPYSELIKVVEYCRIHGCGNCVYGLEDTPERVSVCMFDITPISWELKWQ